MPRQKGLYRIKGKHNGLSYYSVKDGVGDVFRRINEQMSQRVKTEPEFVNTRKYAEEFGVCTTTANAIYESLHLYVPSRTLTRLKKIIFGAMRNQGDRNVGTRNFQDNGWQDVACNLMNANTRVNISDFANFIQSCVMTRATGTTRYNASVSVQYSAFSSLASYYQAAGFDHVSVSFYLLSITTPIYKQNLGKHDILHKSFDRIGAVRFELGKDIQPSGVTGGCHINDYGVEDGKYLRRLVLIVNPYKSNEPLVTNVSYTSALMLPVTITQ